MERADWWKAASQSGCDGWVRYMQTYGGEQKCEAGLGAVLGMDLDDQPAGIYRLLI